MRTRRIFVRCRAPSTFGLGYLRGAEATFMRVRTNKLCGLSLHKLMHGTRQLSSLLRLTRLAAFRGVSVHRYASTKVRQNRRTAEDDGGDFRPPWVYSGSRFLTYTAIPREAIPNTSVTAIATLTQSLVTLLYCAFLADWGEREHIFMPVSCLLHHLVLAN